MMHPILTVTAKQDFVELSHGGRTARIGRDVWPPAWNIDALDREVAQGIVAWFRATSASPRLHLTPIEIVLQMVLNYLNIDPGDAPPAILAALEPTHAPEEPLDVAPREIT